MSELKQALSGLAHNGLKRGSPPSLDELRRFIKSQWTEHGNVSRRPGSWDCAQLPENFWQAHYQNPVGLFCPREDFDECVALPKIPSDRQAAYPRWLSESGSQQNQLSFHLWEPTHASLLSSSMPQPEAACPQAQPQLFFVPALMVDTLGRRIGRGAGFYDKYLASCKDFFAVAVLHSDYCLDHAFPEHWVQEHDMGVQAVLSESHYFEFKESKT